MLTLLGGGSGTKSPRGRAKRRKTIDWNSLFKGLPNLFTLNDLAKKGGARGKSRLYLRQVLVRWGKQGKVKRVGRGRYQKR